MRGTRTITSSLFLLFTSAAIAQEYFPLHTGNAWVYRGPFDSVTVSVGGDEVIGGQTYKRLKNWFGRDRLLRYSEPNVLVAWDEESRSEKPFIDFTTPVDGEFRSAQDECSNRGIVVSRKAEARAPAASVDNALQISYPAANCADAGLDSEYWVPWIGLLKRTAITIAGPRSYDLVYSRTGVTVLAEPEIGFGVAIDRAVYPVTTSLELRADPWTADVRMTLRNGLDAPLALTFPSGQTYEIVIRNARDEVVYTWSASRTFTAGVRDEEFGHGDHVWAEKIPIQSLGTGIYTLEASLVTSNSGRYAASVGFEIR